jgi:hypothetical protein
LSVRANAGGKEVAVTSKSVSVPALTGAFLLMGITALAQGPNPGGAEVSQAVHHDVSQAMRDLPSSPRSMNQVDKPLRLIPKGQLLHNNDPVVQSSAGAFVGTTSGLNIPGVGNGDYGFVPNAAPPDTNGAVGATQYVQWVNESFAVFDKTTGAIAAGFPKAGNTLWSGFGGGCETNNDGDPVVQYDKAANRWVMTQFSVSTTPYLQCVAVSTTSDATGTFNRYSFSQPNFNDYPKLGVWPDGYYISFNMFNGNAFVGGRACAFDRNAMLAGGAATQICFQLSNSFGGLLPSDLDGSTPPPAGSPNYFLAFGTNSLQMWKFHTDFANPSNATFSTTPTIIPVAGFSPACSGGGTCIPQPGTTQQLDSLADRLMHRLAYRNFGDHESLVVNHSVVAGTSVGVRWYELRSPGSAPTVFQQGTYAPDSSYRWMGSIGMDQAGNIALGYSVSSSTLSPSIRYTGRAPTDTLGTLQAESTILTGSGSQTRGLSRWGDYSAMTIDPTDDCTFFYTNEYLKSSGTFNWSTRIASFKFPGCGSSTPVLTTITVSPSSASVVAGGTQQFTATGYDQNNVALNPQPAFTWSATGGGTIGQNGLFTAGGTAGGPFTVTAASGGKTGTASVTVSSSTPVLTTITVSPSSASVAAGGTQQFTATGYDQNHVALNPQPAFTWSVTGGGTIGQSGLFTAGGTAGGPFTVTAASGGKTGTASVTVTGGATPDFSLSVSPASQTVQNGSTAQYTVTINSLNGFNNSVTLTLSGQPAGATVSFSPNPATNTSTLTIVTPSQNGRKSYSLTITGTSGSLTHSTTAQLTTTRN